MNILSLITLTITSMIGTAIVPDEDVVRQQPKLEWITFSSAESDVHIWVVHLGGNVVTMHEYGIDGNTSQTGLLVGVKLTDIADLSARQSLLAEYCRPLAECLIGHKNTTEEVLFFSSDEQLQVKFREYTLPQSDVKL